MMRHTYEITGMSCTGCRERVEKALNAIPGVSAVVTLEPPQAVLSTEKHIPTKKLQEALLAAGDYGLEMVGHRHAGKHSHHPEKSPEIDTHTASHQELKSDKYGKRVS